jgi:hypothetical protein
MLLMLALEVSPILVILLVVRRLLEIDRYPAFLVGTMRSFSYLIELSSSELAGRWDLLALALIGWGFGAVCAEELFFRGVLLPRMGGKHPWLANAALFGLYQLHRPWAIPIRFIEGILIARPTQRLQSLWMAILIRSTEGIVAAVLLVIGVRATGPTPITVDVEFPYLAAEPRPTAWPCAAQSGLPPYGSGSIGQGQIDARYCDLSGLDLSGAGGDLINVSFNSFTEWPAEDRLPAGYDPSLVLAMGQNPGLGVRSLHQRGITGQGVGIGIIDQRLLTGHEEYAGRLRWYEEFSVEAGAGSSMHGPAVASIAVGETVGVAPEADLYYIAVSGSTLQPPVCPGRPPYLELNQLPADHQIRVISISSGWTPAIPGYYNMLDALAEAEEAGLLVVSSNTAQLGGLGRDPLDDPDEFTSYRPGQWWATDFYAGGAALQDRILVPMDSRTTAGPGGIHDTTFYREGGISWSIPYLAGVYALAAQVDPDITPDQFWALAFETGRSVEIEHEGQTYTLGTILDPVALIERIMDDAGG